MKQGCMVDCDHDAEKERCKYHNLEISLHDKSGWPLCIDNWETSNFYNLGINIESCE